MTWRMSNFTFAEDWSDEESIQDYIVWEEDAHYLADQAEGLNLLFGVEPSTILSTQTAPGEIVWDKAEIMRKMIIYKINNSKENM